MSYEDYMKTHLETRLKQSKTQLEEILWQMLHETVVNLRSVLEVDSQIDDAKIYKKVIDDANRVCVKGEKYIAPKIYEEEKNDY